ncbi:MAG TPA: O-antigen ligase family protein [Puia sp.]|nr:O-antigen ligase family protein [Puia sp.]
MRSPVFLKNKLYFLVMVAVLCTTVTGWFNPNSWCIIALLACRLFSGNPLDNIKTAFANRLFVAYFLFTVMGVMGYLYTHNLRTEGLIVSKEATLVAVSFVICAGPFADRQTYRQLITAYSLLLLATSLYCLGRAVYHYITSGDTSFFFYHPLTEPLSQNAVFYSVYVLLGIVFLLSPGGEPAIDAWPPRVRRSLRIVLILFFIGMMILLSSRLMLVITAVILINIFFRRYSYRQNKRLLIAAIAILVFAVSLLSLVDNPIRDRFRETTDGSLTLVRQDTFVSYKHFSSTEIRMLQWRFGFEILNARHAWLFGVSPGDSQDLLDEKYTAANMYIGNPAEGPNRHFRGFLGFNFHDQYLETLVRSGLLGLALLLTIFILLFSRARSTGIKEAWFITVTLAVFFIPEAPLTMQHGIFLFCFFPLFALTSPTLTHPTLNRPT